MYCFRTSILDSQAVLLRGSGLYIYNSFENVNITLVLRSLM